MPTLAESQVFQSPVNVTPDQVSVEAQRAVTENGEAQAHPGDWLVLKLLIASFGLIMAMNVYDFLRGLLGL